MLARLLVSLAIGLVFCGEARAQAEVFFGVTRNQGIDASSYNAGSFVITNESSSGILITDVEIDFSTAMLPDLVFDPEGTAGDKAAKCFEASNGGAAAGLVAPADPCSSPFSSAYQSGYRVLALEFTDFDPAETFTFAVDADPTSIKGTSGQRRQQRGLGLGARAHGRPDPGDLQQRHDAHRRAVSPGRLQRRRRVPAPRKPPGQARARSGWRR